MSTKYLAPGEVLTVSSAGAESDDVIVLGSGSEQLVGVAMGDANDDDDVEVQVTGVFTFDKGSLAIAQGGPCYWDAANEQVEPHPQAGFPLMGVAVDAATAGATTVDVRLNGASGPGRGDHFVMRGAFDCGTTNLTAAEGQRTLFTIPDNCRVVRSYYEITTTLTSATDAATPSFGINTDDTAGILAAVAISDGGNPFDAGLHEGIQDGTAAAFSEKTTAARVVSIATAVETVTAGVGSLVCECVCFE